MVGNKDEINKEWKLSCTYILISEAFTIIAVAEGILAQAKCMGYAI